MGICVKPGCCGSPSIPCGNCTGDKASLYYEVVLAGLVDGGSTCPACPHYNVKFTLSPPVFGDPDCLDDVGDVDIVHDQGCCYFCTIISNEFECSTVMPNILALKIAREVDTGVPTGDYYLWVELLSPIGRVRFTKVYSALPACRELIGEAIPFDTAVGTMPCDGGSATCTITAVSALTEPCCRGRCYPDQTPDSITATVTGIQSIGCGSCSSLNAAYVCNRLVQTDSQLNCFVARFPETCGYDSLALRIGRFDPSAYFFHSSDPTGTTPEGLPFNIVPVAPSSPYAECAQFDGFQIRSTHAVSGQCRAGNGDPYDSGDPATYGTCTLAF